MIFHLIEKEIWEALPKTSYSPESLEKEGFIHFSTRKQLPDTLKRYYSPETEMVALAIDVADLPNDVLKWEESRPGEYFPHVYAPLDLSIVRKVHDARTL